MKLSHPAQAFVASLSLVALCGGLFGYSVGYRRGSDVVVNQASEQRALEARIMDLVVKRNPNATVKDFAGFPEHVVAESAKHGIDFRLVLALIDHESEFTPHAIGSRGEIGLMQVLPQTAKDVCVTLKLDCVVPGRVKPGSDLGTLGDAKANVTIGLAYLAQMRDEFGPGPAMLRGFNRGLAHAREHRPHDRYAERVSMRFLALAHEVQ